MKKIKQLLLNKSRILITLCILCAISFTMFAHGSNASATVTIKKTQPDSGTWTMISGTNIILNADKISLWDAYKNGDYEITGNTSDDFLVFKENGAKLSDGTKLYYSDWDDSNKGVLLAFRRKNAFKSKWTTYNLTNMGITLKYPKAARGLDGQYYDVRVIINDMKIRTGKWTGEYKYVPLLSGPKSGGLHFSSFAYRYNSFTHGTSYNIHIKLYKAGTNTQISTGNSMVWGFSDVDIIDKVSGNSYHKYDKNNYTWAEHVVLKSGYGVKRSPTSNERDVTLYMSQNTQLGHWVNTSKTPDWVYVYHDRINSTSDYNTTDYTTRFVLAIDPHDFHYVWTGSGCGTAFAATTGTMYTGYSEIYDTSIKKANKLNNNKELTVNGSSKTLAFRHYIHRNNQGPTNDNEEYFVNAGPDSGPKKGSATSHKSYTSAKNSDKVVYDDSTSGNPFTVSLTPGQKKVIWQELNYQLSNIDDSLAPYVDEYCELVTPNVGGRVCVQLHRPKAKFSGKVEAKVIHDKTGNYKNPNSLEEGNEVVTDDGSFTIRFTSEISRGTDDAGDTATTPYRIVQKLGSKDGDEVPGTGKPNTGTKNTKALKNGEKDEIVKTSDNYKYESKLKYGETRIICGVLKYKSEVNASATGGGVEDTKYSCVKVWRAPKACGLNADYNYGVHTGQNLGRVGVVNHSYPGSSASYVYSKSEPSRFTEANHYTQEAEIWARPGDSIRFVEESCAGGQYAVNNTPTLDKETYKTIYTNKGTLENAAGTVNSSKAYLFGEKAPVKTNDNPLTYNNIRTWNSTSSGSDFPTGDNVELELLSPSDANTDTYNENSYNSSTYSCESLNSSSFQTNHYQVAGKSSDQTTKVGCHAYSKTGVSSDVGHIIKHSLTWNYLNVNKSVANSTYEKNKKFTANALAKIPYNYNLQPALSSTTESHVAYLGSTYTFNADVYTTPRKNLSFGDSESNNTYATITKKTAISVEYYFIINGVKGATHVMKSNKNLRLNNTGDFSGTVNRTESVENGGYKYHTFSVHIDDSFLSVGDKVCAHMSVYPSDSHNKWMQNSVTGAGDDDIALKEDGAGASNTAERTACYTIAKLPTFSVESSNTYSGGNRGFVTSKYSKRFSGSSTNYLFGSWSEYGVFGRVELTGGRGTASGATLGYQTRNNGVTTNQSRSVTATNVARDEATHGGNICVFSSQTYSNHNCKAASSSSIGEKGVTKDEPIEKYRSRVSKHFEAGDKTSESKPNSSVAYPGSNYTWSGGSPSNYGYVKPSTGVQYANLKNWITDDIDSNFVNRLYTKGNGYLGTGTDSGNIFTYWAEPNIDGETSGHDYTRVIQVDGTLVIDSDIRVGTGSNSDPSITDLSHLVQTVILAKNVEITSRVRHIDAVIIADSVNTCAYSSVENFANGKRAEIGSTISANTCNNPIVFRGPVLTRKITLNRTYGAENGENSIKRAEIFELNSYNYLWSFNIMSRSNQAITTYSRELPPRY